MKRHVTALQRQNAIEARDLMVPSIPDRHLIEDLHTWGQGNRRQLCGSAGCFGGWCPMWPSFAAQGATYLSEDSWVPGLLEADGDVYFNPAAVALRLFGDASLFDARRNGSFTRERGTEKEIILKRLNHLINNTEVF